MPERSARTHTRKPFLWYLGRWAWVFLVGEVTLLLFVPAFFFNKVFHPQVIAAAATIAVGALSALLARRLIAKSSLFLRILFPFLVLLICLVGINWITAGQAGIGFVHDPIYGSIWWGLIPLSTGTLAIVLTLLAWKKSRKKKTARKAAPRSNNHPLRTAPHQRRSESGQSHAQPRPTASPVQSPRSSNPQRTSPASGQASRASARTEPANQSIRVPKRKPKNNHLRLVGSEEHRCPYCLEVVQPNDPRGVIICNICHAYHHKDCWDVTGRCQVPHQAAI